MSRIKFKNLSNLFRTATATAVKFTATVKPSKPSKPSTVTSIVGDAAANRHSSSAKTTSSSNKKELRRKLVKTSLRKTQPVKVVTHHGTPVADFISDAIGEADDAEEGDISTILCGTTELDLYDPSDSIVADGDDSMEDNSNLPWFSNLFNSSTPLRRKELSRDRKIKWIFKNTQKLRFDKLVSLCLARLGTGSMFGVLTKLGRGSGLKEYNACIRGCIETARNCKDEKAEIAQILEAYRLLQLMKERGFPIEEEVFGPFLIYLIDKHMEDQFILLLEIVKDEDVSLHPRLGYYEMLFWIEMNNEEKVQELCKEIAVGESEMGFLLHENYLLALCERDRKDELLQLLDIIDITRISSVDNVATIFRSIGRLSLDAFAEMFILVLNDCDYGSQNISSLIYSYSSSLKNLVVEDTISKFKEMHEKLDLPLVAGSYEKIITFCCDSHKVHLALDLVDEMCQAGLTLSVGTLNTICHTCEETCEYILVRRIYSIVGRYKLKPNGETYRSIINLNVRMKDFHNAYAMLTDLDGLNLRPSASMYNAIIAGYCREKNMDAVLRVLKDMKEADVKPDSQTFSYLINNCTHEEDVVKYYEELKLAGVQATKHVFMALVNGYVSSGQFEKAKEVLLDKGIPVKNLTEIKSALVSALAYHGQMADALDIYEDMKQNGSCLEPKAVISLIENQQFEGKLNLLLGLLEELNDPDPHYWVDGCCRVILYCIRESNLRSAVDLLKRLASKFQDDELAQEFIFDEVFSQLADMKSPDLQIGTDLLVALRKDLNLCPSRKCLDFLLSACVSCKDLQKAQLVWNEYEIAGLPHNILSSLRMYQAYLASGHFEKATDFLSSIPRDDIHVRSIIHACRVSYGKQQETEKKNYGKQKNTKTKKKKT
ncbi:pentatricopeptide repeat-containing protein At4g04790, mitochondrial-like isoform X2 [Silene latifolia]|uniref:pentatricopeptide repeat-containing protein At4g04790, mitochondrial-like isoform X2 n=1 Tax=Silene latifolia TaxID=37657 RepID=UPI003D778CA9